MTRLLLDASALYPLVKIVASRPEVLEEVIDRLSMLDLTLYEACSAALVEYRRGFIRDPTSLCSLVEQLASLVEVVRVEPSWLEGILRTALEHKLTFYDAAYVYVSRLYGYTLVTEDGEILRVCPTAKRLSEALGV